MTSLIREAASGKTGHRRAGVRSRSPRNTGGFGIALDFYTNVEPTPGRDGVRRAVLTTYRPSGQDDAIDIESDTLTHGDRHGRRWPRP